MADQEKGGLNRREVLGAGALAAGVLLAANEKAAAAQAQVEDRGSAIRITNVRGLPAGTKAYIKIETNRDIVGWGEITGLDPRVGIALAESLKELLLNENPTRIEHLWQKM